MDSREIKRETVNFWAKKALFSRENTIRYDAMVKLLYEINDVDPELMTEQEIAVLETAVDECRAWLRDNPKIENEGLF
jgi:hypothetical protein